MKASRSASLISLNLAISAFFSSSQRSMLAGLQDGFKFSWANLRRESKSLPPRKPANRWDHHIWSWGILYTVLITKGFSLGGTVDVEHTGGVVSSYSAISLSQAGFMRLQWPHQGARNLINTDLPAQLRPKSVFVRVVVSFCCVGSILEREINLCKREEHVWCTLKTNKKLWWADFSECSWKHLKMEFFFSRETVSRNDRKIFGRIFFFYWK